MTIQISGATEIDAGYFEVRVNWNGRDLMDMTGAELDRFKAALMVLEELANPAESAGRTRDKGPVA